MARRYFHGGVPGLEVGEFLLAGHGTSRRPYVCLTSDERLARDFAEFYGARSGTGQRGDLYQVRPVGAVERGIPGCDARGGRFRCERAEVVRVLERGLSGVR